MSPAVVVRADAGKDIGGGHVMRCLSVAEALVEQGWNCTFMVNGATPACVPALGAAGHRIVTLKSVGEDALAAEMRLALPEGCDLLVVDHYGLGHGFEARCRSWARRILVIDDLADRRHECDVLLDQTFGRAESAYHGLVPAGCRVLAGTPYALLRPAFAWLRDQALARRAASDRTRILVSLGATDSAGGTLIALDALATIRPTPPVDVVLGAGSPIIAAVRARTAAMGGRLHVDVDGGRMANLMCACDIAIGAGGTTSWERCCLGLPTVLMVTADNQRAIAEALARAGAAALIERTQDAREVAGALRGLMRDARRYHAMAAAAAAVCDGRGVRRVLAELNR